jgi:hypothetical protein
MHLITNDTFCKDPCWNIHTIISKMNSTA